MIKIRLVLTLLVLLSACNVKSPYPGFSKGKKGIYFQLLTLGDSDRKPQYGDYLTADIRYLTLQDSVFFQGRRKLRLQKTKAVGSIDECFRMLNKGEKALFIISADEFFSKTLETDLPEYFKEDSKMKIEIDLIDIQTEKEFSKEKEAFLNWIDDFGEYEKVILKQFLEEKELSVHPSGSGLYYIVLKEGTGKKIEKGDTITVNYEGRFLNGKFFDSTLKRNQPFQFVFGTEWQVVKGLEEGIALMCEGEKALFILPSDLAFGNKGSSTGIIPPFTSLIFEVEILAVN